MMELIGREAELRSIRACIGAGRNVLLEGPVGVGKTHLAAAVAREFNRPVFRIDGDSRFSEQKLTGWFDPPAAVKKGFVPEAFVPGPLVIAMRAGGVLFLNELNRLPEGVQNVLLPAIDERRVSIPRYGDVEAKEGFCVIATQNPKEFVATSHLSEAILDRFELIYLDYQNEDDERRIVEAHVSGLDSRLLSASVALARLSRFHTGVRRGASVRAAISVAEIAAALSESGDSMEAAFLDAALLALPTRIEIERTAESATEGRSESERIIEQLAREAWAGAESSHHSADEAASEKKKNT